MVINQSTEISDGFKFILQLQQKIDIEIDKKKVEKKIDELSILGGQISNKVSRANILRLIIYMNKLIKLNNGVKMGWYMKNNILKSEPFDTLYYDDYNVNTFDLYKNDEKDNIVEVDFGELYDIVAYEMAHRDLGISDLMAQKRVSNISLIERVHYKDLNVDGISKQTRGLKIKDCAYRKSDGFTNYFGDKVDNAVNYDKIIEASVIKAISIILDNYEILDDIENKLIALNQGRKIVLRGDKVLKRLSGIKDLNIRVLGRPVYFNIKITTLQGGN